MKIIILNGPPGSGKDTAADFICSMYNAVHMKLSRPLKMIFDPVFQVGEKTAIKMINEGRDTPQPLLMGMTPREVQMRFFDEFLAPTFGYDILGRLFIRQAATVLRRDIIVVSDGQERDLEPIIAKYGTINIKVIRLRRFGCTWGDHEDFRTDFNPEECGIEWQGIDNNFDKELYHAQIERCLARWGFHPK